MIGAIVEGELRRAKLVVAADGMHSRCRQLLGLEAPQRQRRFGVRTHFQLAPGQEQPPWVDVFVAPGYELYVTPLPDREVLVAGLADSGVLAKPVEKTFCRWFIAQPLLAARLEGSTSVLAPMYRPARGPREARRSARCCPARRRWLPRPHNWWRHVQALMTAELLVNYLPRSAQNNDQWIWADERGRRALLRDCRLLTQAVLSLASHPKLGAKVLSLLRLSPSPLSHFIGVAAGVRHLFSGAQLNATLSAQFEP